MRKPEEKAKEIYFGVLNEGKGMISSYLAKQISMHILNELNYSTEEIFHKYGIGYMGAAIARKDYKKHYLSKYWEKVKEEINKLDQEQL